MRRPSAYRSLYLFFTQDRTFIRQLYKLLGFFPLKPELYRTAFRHKSATVNNEKGKINNERMEFLGDAILDSVISDYLYEKFPEADEGFLTRMRAKIVQRKSMNKIAVEMGLHEFILRDFKNCPNSQSIFGNALEALIGAIYLDRKYRAAKYFILNEYLSRIDLESMMQVQYDHKSSLYHLIQDKKWDLEICTHENIEESEHSIHFLAEIIINGHYISEGKGWSKKEAEQIAAKNALDKLIA